MDNYPFQKATMLEKIQTLQLRLHWTRSEGRQLTPVVAYIT